MPQDKVLQRYPGIRPFENSFFEQSIFFGREYEVDDFSNHIIERGSISVLHGVTGSGKSSFIRAGIAPYLLNNYKKSTNCIFIDLYELIDGSNITESALFIHIGNAINKQLELKLTNEEINEFTKNIVDSNDPKLSTRKRSSAIMDFYLECENVNHKRFIIFFDQFDYLSDIDSDESNAGTKNIVFDILQGFNDALNSEFPTRHSLSSIVLIIRSEYLSLLIDLANRIPGIFNNLYGLKRLNKYNATQCITRPAKQKNLSVPNPEFDVKKPWTYSEQMLAHIIKNVTPKNGKREIELIELQRVCSEIEKNQKKDHFEILELNKSNKKLIDEGRSLYLKKTVNQAFKKNLKGGFFRFFKFWAKQDILYRKLCMNGRRNPVSQDDFIRAFSGIASDDKENEKTPRTLQIENFISELCSPEKRILVKFDDGSGLPKLNYSHDLLAETGQSLRSRLLDKNFRRGIIVGSFALLLLIFAATFISFNKGKLDDIRNFKKLTMIAKNNAETERQNAGIERLNADTERQNIEIVRERAEAEREKANRVKEEVKNIAATQKDNAKIERLNAETERNNTEIEREKAETVRKEAKTIARNFAAETISVLSDSMNSYNNLFTDSLETGRLFEALSYLDKANSRIKGTQQVLKKTDNKFWDNAIHTKATVYKNKEAFISSILQAEKNRRKLLSQIRITTNKDATHEKSSDYNTTSKFFGCPRYPRINKKLKVKVYKNNSCILTTFIKPNFNSNTGENQYSLIQENELKMVSSVDPVLGLKGNFFAYYDKSNNNLIWGDSTDSKSLRYSEISEYIHTTTSVEIISHFDSGDRSLIVLVGTYAGEMVKLRLPLSKSKTNTSNIPVELIRLAQTTQAISSIRHHGSKIFVAVGQSIQIRDTESLKIVASLDVSETDYKIATADKSQKQKLALSIGAFEINQEKNALYALSKNKENVYKYNLPLNIPELIVIDSCNIGRRATAVAISSNLKTILVGGGGKNGGGNELFKFSIDDKLSPFACLKISGSKTKAEIDRIVFSPKSTDFKVVGQNRNKGFVGISDNNVVNKSEYVGKTRKLVNSIYYDSAFNEWISTTFVPEIIIDKQIIKGDSKHRFVAAYKTSQDEVIIASRYINGASCIWKGKISKKIENKKLCEDKENVLYETDVKINWAEVDKNKKLMVVINNNSDIAVISLDDNDPLDHVEVQHSNARLWKAKFFYPKEGVQLLATADNLGMIKFWSFDRLKTKGQLDQLFSIQVPALKYYRNIIQDMDIKCLGNGDCLLATPVTGKDSKNNKLYYWKFKM